MLWLDNVPPLPCASAVLQRGTWRAPASPRSCRTASIIKKMSATQVNLKLIPDVDGTPAIVQLVAYNLTDIQVKGGWSGPARLHLVPHVNAPVADLPVRRVAGGLHFIANLTLPYGRVLFDYRMNRGD